MRFIQRSSIALLLLLIYTTAGAAVRSSLQGKVTDSKGVSIPGVVVEFPDIKSGAVTDASGNYQITNLPSGTYLLSVHGLNYATQSIQVKLNGATTKNITLKESVVEQQEVVITGSGAGVEQRRSPVPIESIGIKQLQQTPSTNIIDAVTRLPGVSQLTTGPAISKPVIRGLGYNRIITLNDGIRQEGQQWGDEHGIEIDDYNVSRVEVLKGPASLAYGSDAMAGVINIISENPAPEGTIMGSLTANYQTNDGLAALHAQLSGKTNGFVWDAYVTGKTAHDYHNAYDGYVYGTGFHNLNYGGSIGVNKHWGSSRLAFTQFDQRLGIAEGERDSATGNFLRPAVVNGQAAEEVAPNEATYKLGLPQQHIVHQKLSWENSLYLANGSRLGLTLGYQQNVRQEFENPLVPDEAGLHFQLRTFNYDLHYIAAAWDGWKLTTGINGMHQQNENKGVEFLIPDYQLTDIGAYAIVRKDFKRWTMSGGIRYDARFMGTQNLYLDSAGERVGSGTVGSYNRFPAFNRTFTSPTGSFGATYAASKHIDIKANAAAGYRAPNIAELAANGVHEGTIRYEYGSSDLKAEHSVQGDIGADYHSDHVSVTAAVFYNYIHNYVYIRKLQGVFGNDSIPTLNNDEGVPAYAYQQTNAHLFGGEFYADIHPHPFDWLHLENTISYVQGRNASGTDSTKYLPDIPPLRWLVGLKAQARGIGNYLRNTYVRVEVDNNFSQHDVLSAYGSETPTVGYSLLNASIGAEITNRHGNTLFTLTVAGQNLTDNTYQSHLSRLKYADVNPLTGRSGIWAVGRNISILLTAPLQWNLHKKPVEAPVEN